MFNNNRKTIPALAARTALAVALAAAPVSFTAPARAAPLKAETSIASGLTNIVVQTMGKFARRDHGIDIQINSGQTLTKTTLALASGKLDLTATPPEVFALLQKGAGPYKKLGEEATAASGNLRGLFGFVGGWFHAIAWADSGVESYPDLKGKKVFLGPPAGGANRAAASIIRAAAGYEADRDYQGARLDWGAGLQAMQDGQFDVFMRPAPVGSALIDQLGAQRKFRLLSMRAEDLQSEAWKQFTANPWYTRGVIPAGTYDGQVNNHEDVVTGVFTMQVTAHKRLDDETAYKLTAAFFDNADEAKSTVALLKYMDESEPLIGMNIPLHPGALRYFREKGVAVPDNLLPPEAR